MEESQFKKNDQSFTCINCGTQIQPLGYTSRDHCPKCLVSLHVDVNPGDRKNECKGILIPVNATYKSNKGYVINYICKKCKEKHNNKASKDDSLKAILSLMNGTYNLYKEN